MKYNCPIDGYHILNSQCINCKWKEDDGDRRYCNAPYDRGYPEKYINNTCQRAINHYGWYKQELQATEEMGELLAVLNQHKRGKVSREDVISEIADVMVMCEQLALIYGKTEVKQEMFMKLERLNDRIDNKTNE